MELLAGAPAGTQLVRLRANLFAYEMLTLGGLADFEEAATIYRTCRRAGFTPRSLTDCLVAVTAIAAGARLLHNDGDFAVIAEHSALEIEPLA